MTLLLTINGMLKISHTVAHLIESTRARACVCERERERESVCVCVCVCERACFPVCVRAYTCVYV